MGFIPYDYKNGHPDPWVYMETSAIGAIHVGTALVLSSGKLAKCTGTSQPDYISMYDGIELVRKINALEKFLWNHGFNPDTIK